MSEMLEKVARAMRAVEWKADLWDEVTNNEGDKEYWRDHARAALLAMREPTEPMVRAGDKAERDTLHPEDTVAIWQAMLSAALADPR